MQFKIDTHMHTIASGHAYNTLNEMMAAAIRKDMDVVCLTEHGPAMPGSAHPYYFTNMRVIEKTNWQKGIGRMNFDGQYVHLIKGFEANILDYDGNTDYDDLGDDIGDLKYIIASFHSVCLKPGTCEQNTNAYIGAIKKPYVMTLGHIDDGRIPCDYEKVIAAAKENNVLIEVNNSSQSTKTFRVGAKENTLKYLEICKDIGAMIVLGSDAHFDEDVGNFSRIIPLLEEINFPEHLIINSDKAKFLGWIRNKYENRKMLERLLK